MIQRSFDVVPASGTDVVSTLCNFEYPTSDFVSFSTSDQRYLNVDPQNDEMTQTSKCWLGGGVFENRKYQSFIIFIFFYASNLSYSVSKV